VTTLRRNERARPADGADRRGWRQHSSGNLTNDGENLLISDNQISCSGDKAATESCRFGQQRRHVGFESRTNHQCGRPGLVRINRALLHEQYGQPVPDNYYTPIGSGSSPPGLGQTPRVESYTEDRATGMVTLRISPSWDVVPRGVALA